jgi:orotidine-5'-phosphate decarboxylase
MPAVANPRIIIALDFSDRQRLEAIIEQLDPGSCRLKVGKELFTTFGPEIIHWLQGKGFDIFLDLKFHDIPNTAAMAVKAAAQLGVWMVNVHASGGRKMMTACREVLQSFQNPPLLIAVTILTSLQTSDIRELGFNGTAKQAVVRLANLAKQSGLNGVVCSAQESSELRDALGSEFCLVTPGIRPDFAKTDDQTRIVTPAQAIAEGSHYLVIGRPVTRAENPAQALAAIMSEIEGQ